MLCLQFLSKFKIIEKIKEKNMFNEKKIVLWDRCLGKPPGARLESFMGG